MEKADIIRSDRRTISIEITNDLRLIVRAPLRMSNADIEKFICEKTPWIEKHIEIVKSRNRTYAENAKPFSKDDLTALRKQALIAIPPKVEALAHIIGVSYKKITIRNQLTRWGSCSSNGNLSFNCLLMLCPDEVVDYVIIHELCHRKHMNHSKAFWATVKKYCPEYKKQQLWLKTNGNELIYRLRTIT